jgi:DNA helicase-2/ATP-dependent DNA helicase PcrA
VLGKNPLEILLTLYYLEEDKKISTTRTKEDLEKAKGEILATVEEIKTSNFTCSHSILCRNCEYQMLCQGDRA